MPKRRHQPEDGLPYNKDHFISTEFHLIWGTDMDQTEYCDEAKGMSC